MVQQISSAQNSFFKMLISLEKSRERKKEGILIVEGSKEVSLAIEAGYEIITFIFSSSLYNIMIENLPFVISKDIELVDLSPQLFEKITYRGKAAKIVALAKPKQMSLEHFTIKNDALILVIEGVEKPGNLGSIFRTADASGVDGIIICGTGTDIYNPNVIRSSLGTCFTNNVALSTNIDCLAWLRKHHFNIYITHLESSANCYEMEFKGNCALVLGTEATGVSDFWINKGMKNIKIPMMGKIDSMNVSNAAAVLMYEAQRQRKKLFF